MQNKIITKLSLLIVLVMMFTLASCMEKDPWSDAIYTSDTEVGEGSKTVRVEVVVGENKITFTLHTDADTLGEALIENKLIEGEDSQYGIYIKKVNGILADYDKNGAYWGFYDHNGEYLMSGVDTTPITDGDHFQLVYEK